MCINIREEQKRELLKIEAEREQLDEITKDMEYKFEEFKQDIENQRALFERLEEYWQDSSIGKKFLVEQENIMEISKKAEKIYLKAYEDIEKSKKQLYQKENIIYNQINSNEGEK